MENQLTEQIISAIKLEDISESYMKAIEIVSDVIINTGNYTVNDKIAVVPLETGCGKSTITNLALAWVVRNDLANAGTIILKERTEDCDYTVNQINELCGSEVAVSYHSKLFVINGAYSYRFGAEYRATYISILSWL
jgi:ABC-type glutathione transport system ATPase component